MKSTQPETKYVGDFETTNDTPDSARVWASGMYNIETGEFFYGQNLEWTMKFWYTHPGIYYYHNLKFDGNFIIPYLLKHNFTCVNDEKFLRPNTFKTIISDRGQFYMISIMFKGKVKITIYDSFKIITLSVKNIASAFDLPEPKGEIDYTAPRPVGHIITPEEQDYIRRDCSIVGKALQTLFKQGLTRMTQGSNAYTFLKKDFDNFRRYFPVLPLEVDKSLRQAYKGGVCLVADQAKGVDIGEGIVIDKNSMYPDKMRNSPMPFGKPVFYEGVYKYDPVFPLYIQIFTCQFELKEDHLPTLQDKSGRYGFNNTDYLKSSEGNDMTLCMTNPDLEIFFSHYNVYNVIWHSGFKFQQSYTLFSHFVDYWYKVKEDAAKEGNKSMKQIAKIMLNSCYGKFATNPNRLSVSPVLQEDEKVHYVITKEEQIEPQYIPVAAFITAWARYDILTSAQKLFDRFLYCDTDSLHLRGTEMPQGLEIDKYKLGAWDCELKFRRARYLRAKTYIEEDYEGQLHVTCAGLPHDMHHLITWDNFYPGLELFGKLSHRTVKDGVYLKPGPFSIKA